jgi:TatA/E family protein of Tat protein translocase
MPELILILVVALLVFGPNRLPELARSLGRGLAEFRRASSDLRDQLMTEPPRPPPAPAPALPDPAPTEPADASGEPAARPAPPPTPGG